MKQVVLDSEFANVWVYPNKKVIHHQFKKYTYGDKLKDVLLTGLKTLEKHNCNKWLSDDRVNSALSQEDNEWSVKVWAPLAVKAGWKYWALVLPEKLIGKLYMKRVVADFAKMGVKVELFTSSEEGLAWLDKQ